MNASEISEMDLTPGQCSVLSCAPISRAHARREKLIAAARLLFTENGFHSTGIAQIAKQSGVLVGQIYRDFANKEEIVAAIVGRDLEDFLAEKALADAIEARDVEAVRDWVRHFVVANAQKDYRLRAEIVAESARNERIAAIFKAIHERVRCNIVRALEMLAPHPGKAAERKIVAGVILTISGGLFHRFLAEGSVDAAVLKTLVSLADREIDSLVSC